jgi:copper(I)-binding protein
MRAWLAVLAVACLAQSANAAVMVEHAWARATPPGSTVGVVYGNFRSDEADEVVGLSSPVAERVEVHASSSEGGMMKMRMLNALALPAKTNVQLQPAGTHIMLTGLRTSLVAGTSFELTLRFRSATPLTLKVRVLAPGEAEPTG